MKRLALAAITAALAACSSQTKEPPAWVPIEPVAAAPAVQKHEEGPREYFVNTTARMSLADTIRDLGNLMTGGIQDLARGGSGSHTDIRFYASITHHVNVLRVIEEGRRDPDLVYPLLCKEVERSLEDLETLQNKYNFQVVSGAAGKPVPHLSSHDPYYDSHFSYEHAIWELPRRYTSAYSVFYVFAAINKPPPPKLLAKWIEAKRDPVFICVDMNVWLIDQYFREAAWLHTDAGKIQLDLREELKLTSKSARRSRWNAGVDKDDPLLKFQGIQEMPETIDVLVIPGDIPGDDKLKQKVIDNYLKFAKSS